MAEVLAKQPRPRGPRLAIVTNAGGPGVLATDALISGGGELAALAPETVGGARRVLPPHWSHGNPIDILGDAEPDRYARALEIAAKDPNSDGLLVILTPQAMTDPTQTAERLKGYAQDRRQAGPGELDGRRRGRRPARRSSTRPASPPSPTPTPPAGAFTHMWRYSRQPPRPLRDPDLPATTTTPPTAPPPAALVARRPQGGADLPDRVRVEAAARRLRHPDRRDPRRRQRGRGRRRGRGDRLPGRAQAPLRDDHAQDRRRRRLPQPRRRDAVRAAYRAIAGVGARAGRRRSTSWA